jgi:AcrR family transcriptional regulator
METVAAARSTARLAPRAERVPLRKLPGGRHGLTPEQVVASQRRRLMDALVEAAGELGYAETNVAEVLGRANVSRKTFYELFATKDECLYAVFDEAAGCLRSTVQQAYEEGVTPQERIDAAVGILLRWVEAEPARARVCLIELPTTGAEGRKRIAATLTWLSSVMADWLGDLDLPELLPEMLVGGVHSMLVQRLVNDVPDLPALGTDLNEVWSMLERWSDR